MNVALTHVNIYVFPTINSLAAFFSKISDYNFFVYQSTRGEVPFV